MCYDDGDAADVWLTTHPRSRKRYRCDECFGPIPRGVVYTRIGYLYDGSWSTLRVHVECYELWQFVHHVLCGGEGLIMIGGLHDEISGYEYDEDDGVGTPLMDVFHEIRTTYEAMP